MLNDYIKRYKRCTIFGAILMAVTAIFMMFFPLSMMEMAVRVFSIGMAVTGIIHIIFYVLLDTEMRHFSNDLFVGVLSLALSVVIFMNVNEVTRFLIYIVGAWMMVKGVMGLQFSLRLIDVIEFNWIYLFLISVAEILASLLVVINPFGMAQLLVRVAGICLLTTEVFDIMISLYVLRSLDYTKRPRIY
ncbi:MAG: DUF308 domain-containing protein [Erysipelotrichaceae bacterium]|nr:DUF308 domain-containing protein [Erysipelotrichaceae bacterium]